MSQIFNAVLVLCMPSVYGQVTSVLPDDSAHLLCLDILGEGFDHTLNLHAQKCSGSPCACSTLSCLLSPF